jgi:polyketide synthase PksJ
MDVQTSRRDPVVKSRNGGAALEQSITAIWKDILKREEIAPTDDFFDLGGTSLDLIRVFSRVNKEFGLSLNGSMLESDPTIAGMTSCVAAARGAAL